MLSSRYTSAAESDLVACVEFLQSQSVDAAIRLLESFGQTVEFLNRSPEIGELCPYPNPLLEGTRVWRINGFKNHLIFYRVHAKELEIIRVLHGSRDLEVIFGGGEK